ncbi:MAG: hypothetical protein ACI4PU_01660, partial [Intestinibacter sp.]
MRALIFQNINQHNMTNKIMLKDSVLAYAKYLKGSVLAYAKYLKCRMRCIRIYALGELYQTK